jgi:type II secretory pathway pseudopilin PulG
MKNSANRKAFSMVTAIIVIFIMATVSALILGISNRTLYATTAQYQKEQARLLARSYTELAMLYIIHYDRVANNNCIQKINANFGDPNNLYYIETNIQYIGNSHLFPNGCGNNITPTWSVVSPTGFDASLSLVIDVYITYKDFDDPIGRDTTFFRRTVQKL